MRVAGLVLAAGGGRRLGGRPKALLTHRGRPLVENAAHTLRAGGCAETLVVLGAGAEEVRRRAVLPDCRLLDNPDWCAGMGSSLRVGLAALETLSPLPSAVLVLLVDQPGIGAEAVRRLLAAHRGRADLLAAGYRGRRGHPVLFGAEHWAGVAASATGDQGARQYLRAHATALSLVDAADVADPGDVDTPDDLHRLLP